MVGKVSRLSLLSLTLLLIGSVMQPLWAQEPPPPPDRAGVEEGDPGDHPPMPPGFTPPGPGGGHEFSGGRPGKGFMRGKDPKEMEAFREHQQKMQMLRTTAEGYKNLAELYASQDKIDDAVIQFREILKLAEQVQNPMEQNQISKQLGQVYMGISELYIKKERFADAEKVLTEGADKMKAAEPEVASRHFLHLGNVLRKAGRVTEAESAFKKAIEISTAELKKAPPFPAAPGKK